MNIAITGALGHIGSALFRYRLLDNDGDLRLIDNLATQRFTSLFVVPLTARCRYHFVEADVTTADLVPLFDRCSSVIHLAALTDAATSHERAEEVERVNLRGTLRVADACARVGARLVFVSTTSIYGEADGTVDEVSPVAPQSPYAASKLSAEQYLRNHHATLNATILRFGTIYGTSPGMRFHTAVNRWCWQAATGQPITVWRTAMDQKRPYLELGDACRALDRAAGVGFARGETYNVVTENATPRQIVELIREHAPDLRVELTDSRVMNQLSYEVSSEKARAAGFVTTGNLRDGIAQTMGMLGRLR